MGGFRVGEIPWARRQGRGLVCPFCGEPSAIVSHGDLADDPVRLELYCDSEFCEAREVAVLLLRANLPQALLRADVQALRAVDEGTEDERRAAGRDQDYIGLDAAVGMVRDFQGNALERRQRPTKITVEVLPDRQDQ